jgi:hypothetical protein
LIAPPSTSPRSCGIPSAGRAGMRTSRAKRTSEGGDTPEESTSCTWPSKSLIARRVQWVHCSIAMRVAEWQVAQHPHGRPHTAATAGRCVAPRQRVRCVQRRQCCGGGWSVVRSGRQPARCILPRSHQITRCTAQRTLTAPCIGQVAQLAESVAPGLRPDG